ncbi:hypothetical protein D3C71_2000310 [compost metagenome]
MDAGGQYNRASNAAVVVAVVAPVALAPRIMMVSADQPNERNEARAKTVLTERWPLLVELPRTV